MTNPYEPTTGYPVEGDSKVEAAKTVASNATDRAADVAGTAKENAGAVKDTAKAVGGDVVETAKAEVANVVDEAKTHARTLLDEGMLQLRGGAETGQSKLAEIVRSVVDELDDLSRGNATNGMVSQFAGQAQSFGDQAASWLEQKGTDEIMLDVRRFAARKPVTFLALAAGAGFAASRLVRGLQGAASDEQDTHRFAQTGLERGRYDAAPTYGYGQQAAYSGQAYPGAGSETMAEPAYGSQATYAYGTTMHTTGQEPAGQYGTPGYDQPAALGEIPAFGQTGDVDGYAAEGQEPRR